VTDALPAIGEQHQRGRMIPEILAKLRISAARLSPSDRSPSVGAPVVVRPLPATGANLFDPFHDAEVRDA